MRGGYPPGTTTQDLKRGGIIQDPVHCVECSAEVTSESHADWCDLQDEDMQTLKELAAEEQRAVEYDPVEHGER